MHRHPNRPLIVEEPVLKILFGVAFLGPDALTAGTRRAHAEEPIVLIVQLLVVVDRGYVAHTALSYLFLYIY